MLVMVYVYLRISCVVANRHDDMVQIKVHQVSIHCWITLQQIKFRVYIAGLCALLAQIESKFIMMCRSVVAEKRS